MNQQINIGLQEIFKNKGGKNIDRISGTDIRSSFQLYDLIYFNGDIFNKLGKKSLRALFLASSRDKGKVSTFVYQIIEGVCIIDFAPNIAFHLRAGEQRMEIYKEIIQIQLVTFMMVIWGYIRDSSIDLLRLRTPYGKLFRCVYVKYFGLPKFSDKIFDTLKFIFDTPIIKSPSPTKIGYKNWENSCYLDSLLIFLFENPNPFWREILFTPPINTDSYPRDDFGMEVSVCPASDDTTVTTHEEALDLARKISVQLLQDYKMLNFKTRKPIKCVDVRKLLSKCNPAILADGTYDYFNVGEIYDGLCELFPKMKMLISEQTIRASGKKEQTKSVWLNTIPMWDFMDSHSDATDDYKVIRWGEITTPVLIFINTGVPRVRYLNKIGIEKGKFYIDHTEYKFEKKKIRAFNEYIINKRYRLDGVITLKGISEYSEGGKHYTAYIRKGKTKKWFYYDDLNPTLTIVDSLPEIGVWLEGSGHMPAMYFYSRTQ